MTRRKRMEFAEFTKDEQVIVDKIVARAASLYSYAGIKRFRCDIQMDIAAVHNTTPLRLKDLSEAHDVDFAHDIAGINRHLDRNTGQLTDCFMPRFASDGKGQ